MTLWLFSAQSFMNFITISRIKGPPEVFVLICVNSKNNDNLKVWKGPAYSSYLSFSQVFLTIVHSELRILIVLVCYELCIYGDHFVVK